MDKINWIKSQLLLGESASDATSRLNTLITVVNPIPREMISVPVDVDNLWSIVPPLEVFKVLNTLLWDRILRAIEQNNKALIQNYITALVAGGCLTPSTAGKIAVALSGEIPDPDWQPTVVTTTARLAGYTDITVGECQTAIDNEK